jgi:hypothetical protein
MKALAPLAKKLCAFARNFRSPPEIFRRFLEVFRSRQKGLGAEENTEYLPGAPFRFWGRQKNASLLF